MCVCGHRDRERQHEGQRGQETEAEREAARVND